METRCKDKKCKVKIAALENRVKLLHSAIQHLLAEDFDAADHDLADLDRAGATRLNPKGKLVKGITMKKPKTANVHGFVGVGATVSAAKRDAERQIRETSAGNWIPVLYRFRRTQWLLWRDLSGWNYRNITVVTGALYGCGYATQAEAERALRRHAAQTDCIIGEDDGAWIADAKDKAEHLSWYAWKVRYKQARDAGHADDEARMLADNPPHLL